ncbi:SDR family oxidoreductase [Puniceicoccales bacterium CK1056]|uniref:Enoyl-[acyl-carrier-protein] reductase [NADH] n=1 Tax=Oceanipulchritudo coccoides TaxID=2706888 RepID=A0A6B2M5A3_9BACT|nr:SDR family oxidoreductase [Oceanipulchritudo coccoides]NDV62985.1 SDR family oxidoreductase [Oceanipulchritudo coccoides]
MSFLNISKKRFLVCGLGNRRSVAWAVGQTLEEAGAEVIYTIRNDKRAGELKKLLKERPFLLCDVEYEDDIATLGERVREEYGELDGFVHSIAFANFSEGLVPFHETKRKDFLQATQISAFSLVELSRSLKPVLKPDASVVAIGISSSVTAANYGYMSPIKNALEGCVRFLAKSFSKDSEIRFNSVNAGPLRTKSSAGIPGYLDNYLYAEQLTYRKRALTTQEVADTVVYLLSPRSSGINAQGIVVNAGMDWNYFDESVVEKASRPELSRGNSDA